MMEQNEKHEEMTQHQEQPAAEVKTAEVEEQPVVRDIDAMVAEAEQRGYLRGRNEVLEEQMEARGLWEMARRDDDDDDDARSEVEILRSITPDVWGR